jgi:aspartate kinase
MTTVVQKFGGTSVADARARKAAALRVKEAVTQGRRVAVVVSAMGRMGEPYATDTLLSLVDREAGDAEEGSPPVSPARDLDLLAACGEIVSAVVFAQSLRRVGLSHVVPLTGWQAGVITDRSFRDAKILEVRPERVQQTLDEGGIPVVTGFQGMTEDGEITTLGRGGSDTTAAALGVALGADEVAIFTDVAGVMTADPRIVPEARILHRIDYEETFELANLGARVVHPRAVEIARQGSVPLRVLSTFGAGEGTWIGPRLSRMRAVHDRWQRRDRTHTVVGVTARLGLAQVETGVDSHGPVPARVVFEALGAEGISLDLIHVAPGRTTFVVRETDLVATRSVLARLLGEEAFHARRGLAKVAVVGSAIHDFPGVMALFMEALARAGAEVLATSDSHQAIAALLAEEAAQPAVRALHDAFRLGEADASDEAASPGSDRLAGGR